MVVKSQPAAKLENKGYNRGLILGLTMAESMLLLVFCLLLVAAAIINAERRKALEAIQQRNVANNETETVKQELIAIRKEDEKLTDQVLELSRHLALIDDGSPDKAERLKAEWRELVQARDGLRAYQQLGLKPEAVADLARAADVMKRFGLDPAEPAALERSLEKIAVPATEDKNSKPHEWPPIINLSEAGGYFFRSGSAELTKAFEDRLRGQISNEIADNLERYQVDVIEVIGHTDEQQIARAGSNLDQSVIDVVDGKRPVTSIVPADNAGLGLARAIAVANILRSDPKLKDAAILPLSAAQLVLPGDVLTTGRAGDVESRRRIEIRIRRRTDHNGP